MNCVYVRVWHLIPNLRIPPKKNKHLDGLLGGESDAPGLGVRLLPDVGTDGQHLGKEK